MKIKDKVKMRGRCRFTIRDAETGEIVEQTPWRDNLVTDVGEEMYAQLMKGDTIDPCNYCAVGDDNTPAAEADTVLGSELGRLEVTEITIAGSVVTYSTFFGSGDANGCYDELTECLTEGGWKYIKDVQKGEQILTLNEQGCLEYQPNLKTHKYSHSGIMYSLQRPGRFNLLITPKHWLIVKNHSWHDHMRRSKILTGRQWHHDLFKPVMTENCLHGKWDMIKSGEWHGEEPETITIPALKYKMQAWKTKYIKEKPERKFKTSPFLKLTAWYLSEGSVDYGTTGNPNRTKISQIKKEENRQEIVELCKELKLNYSINKKGININDNQIATYFTAFGKNALEKRSPLYIKRLSQKLIQEFLHTYMKGDGNLKKNYLFTSSPAMRDDLQELGIKAGYGADYTAYISSNSFSEKEKYTIRLLKGKSHLAIGRGHSLKPVPFSGFVYCLEVPNHVFLVRREGKTVFCGNTWWEVGMLNAAVGGVLIARTVLGGAQVKNAANTVTIDYELSVT